MDKLVMASNDVVYQEMLMSRVKGRPDKRSRQIIELQFLLKARSEQLVHEVCKVMECCDKIEFLEYENADLRHRLDSLADYEKIIEEYEALKAYVAMIQQLI